MSSYHRQGPTPITLLMNAIIKNPFSWIQTEIWISHQNQTICSLCHNQHFLKIFIKSPSITFQVIAEVVP